MMMILMTILVKKDSISSKSKTVCLSRPHICGHFYIQQNAVGGLSYKVKKAEQYPLIRSAYRHAENYTKLVFFRTTLLIAPSPNANKSPPTRHRRTFITPEPRGVIIETIIKSSIPAAREPQRQSHAFCFADTLTSTSIAMNTNIRKTFTIIHMMRFPAVSVPRSKDRPEMAPPGIAPIK